MLSKRCSTAPSLSPEAYKAIAKSNLASKFGTKFKNISIAINLLIESKLKIKKISNFYETPSYPNKNLPKFANIGLIAEYDFDHTKLIRKISLIENVLPHASLKVFP